MYQSKTDSSRKFGSAFRGARFDDYHSTPQPGETNENERSTSQEHGVDKVNTMGKDKTPHDKRNTSASVDTPESVVQAHGAAHTVHIQSNADGTHRTSSAHPDGYTHETEHGSAKEAYDSAEKLSLEAGGEKQAVSSKRGMHPDQQEAASEERGYEATDLV